MNLFIFAVTSNVSYNKELNVNLIFVGNKRKSGVSFYILTEKVLFGSYFLYVSCIRPQFILRFYCKLRIKVEMVHCGVHCAVYTHLIVSLACKEGEQRF
jgi:hypothetical protein